MNALSMRRKATKMPDGNVLGNAQGSSILDTCLNDLVGLVGRNDVALRWCRTDAVRAIDLSTGESSESENGSSEAHVGKVGLWF
jgi:hypothetical protein